MVLCWQRWAWRSTTRQEAARKETAKDSLHFFVTSLTDPMVIWEYAHPVPLLLKDHSSQESGLQINLLETYQLASHGRASLLLG